MMSGAITHGSITLLDGYSPQCNTVLFPFQQTLPCIGARVPRLAAFPPTLISRPPLIAHDAVSSNSNLLMSVSFFASNTILCALLVDPLDLLWSTHIIWYLYPTGTGRELLPDTNTTFPSALLQKLFTILGNWPSSVSFQSTFQHNAYFPYLLHSIWCQPTTRVPAFYIFYLLPRFPLLWVQ